MPLRGVHAQRVRRGATDDREPGRQGPRERLEELRAVPREPIGEHDERERVCAPRRAHGTRELRAGLRRVRRVTRDHEAIEAQALAADADDAEGVIDLVTAALCDDALRRAPDEDER
jgi:hypothetical protein